MNHPISRRNFLKNLFLSLLTLIGITTSGVLYARKIEPNWLSITSHNISSKLIPKSFNNVTILQFSDTHVGFQYQLKNLRKTVKIINQLRPDIVVFTGDLIDQPLEFSEQAQVQISRILSQIQAPLGKYAVYGNHDYGGYGKNFYQTIINQSEFTLLTNANDYIYNEQNESIRIAGIDDPIFGSPNFEQTFQHIKKNEFCIFLSHAPDLADEASKYPVTLQLSGHSHGGQIQIPLLGPLITPSYAENYLEGMYNIDGIKLYVNRGLGTTRLPLRFLSRPEISLFTLQSSKL